MEGFIVGLWVFVTILAWINVGRGNQIRELYKRVEELEKKLEKKDEQNGS